MLPFENLTGNAELAYLATGLAEDTSTTLAQIDPVHLSVIGTAAQPIAQPALSIADIGRKLGVDFVVLSSLRLDGARIRVTSRLLRVADGEQVWSASIDRQLTNVLGLQRELSTAIAEQIRLRLSPEVAAAIDRRQTQNPAAYALYLKGRFDGSSLRRRPFGGPWNISNRRLPWIPTTRSLGPASRLRPSLRYVPRTQSLWLRRQSPSMR